MQPGKAQPRSLWQWKRLIFNYPLLLIPASAGLMQVEE